MRTPKPYRVVVRLTRSSLLLLVAAFGSSTREFMNFPSSALSLLLLSLGDFDADKLRQENPLLGMILFTMYAVITVFVLLTMMLKIVDNAFHDMRVAMYDVRHKRENLALQMRLALRKVGQPRLCVAKR